MDNSTIQQLAVAAPLLAGLGALSYNHLKKRATNPNNLPFPPGPDRKPVIGNLLDIPTEKEWATYHSWAQKYGDIVYVEALGQPIIILDSMEAVNDLLEKRSSSYSGRPETVMVHELMEFGWSMALNNGEKWRQQRRAFNPYLTRIATGEFKDLQIQESRAFLKNMVANPDYNHQTRQLFGSMMIKSCYGQKKDEYIEKAEEAMAILSSSILPGAFMVDVIPWLKYVPSWFPGANFQKIAARGRTITAQALDEPMVDVKDSMAKGTAVPCFATRMLEAGEDEQIVRDLMGVAYLAGADTTVAYLDGFMLAMVAHPQVQQRAREEIDRVVGPNRLPDFSDRPNLPYIEGILMETLRWMPVTPLGLPHRTTQQDEYRGYFIPKDAVVLANCWSILHDPVAYPEPEQFKPERWLKVVDGVSVLDESVRDSRMAGAFGFGRRVCIGRHLAENSLWSVMVGMLATFSMTSGLNSKGDPIIPSIEWNSGLLVRPAPYKSVIKPRSAHHAKLIRQAE